MIIHPVFVLFFIKSHYRVIDGFLFISAHVQEIYNLTWQLNCWDFTSEILHIHLEDLPPNSFFRLARI